MICPGSGYSYAKNYFENKAYNLGVPNGIPTNCEVDQGFGYLIVSGTSTSSSSSSWTDSELNSMWNTIYNDMLNNAPSCSGSSEDKKIYSISFQCLTIGGLPAGYAIGYMVKYCCMDDEVPD